MGNWPLIWGMAGTGFFRVKSLQDTDNYTLFKGRGHMIQTEQLSPDTIIFHVQGPFP